MRNQALFLIAQNQTLLHAHQYTVQKPHFFIFASNEPDFLCQIMHKMPWKSVENNLIDW